MRSPAPPSPARQTRRRPGRDLLAIWLLGTLGPAAHAQSIGDFNGAYRSVPAPRAAPATPPRIEPSPVIAPSPKARQHHKKPQPTPRRHQARTSPTPATPAPAPPPAPVATPPPPPPMPTPSAPTPIVVKPLAQPAPQPPVVRAIAPRPVPPAPPMPGAPDLPQWPLGLAVLLGGAAGWALWRRKSAPDIVVDPPQDITPDAPQAAPEPAEPPPFVPGLTPTTPDLTLDFVPTRFSTTLAEAILRYRLTVTNHTDHPLGPLVIAGAMEDAGREDDEPPVAEEAPETPTFRPAPGFSPHPHFTPDPILAPSETPAETVADVSADTPPKPPRTDAELPELHRVPLLNPGESADLQGQLRLHLADIAPMLVGGAALFVPLVRLNAQGERMDAEETPPASVMLCMAVGEATGDPAAEALGPFRLDAGPVIARHLAVRDMMMRETSEPAAV